MPQYVIYCRKSTESEEKQVLSIESQINELKEFCKRMDLPVSDVLTECKSAKLPGRPIFKEMLEKIYKGQYAGVVCWKLDRLARNPLDGSSIVWALDQGKINEIATPHGSFKNNSTDKFMMQIEFGMAKKYVDDLSDNIKRGIRAKLEKGWLPCLPPLGYLNEPKERTIVKDPERFSLIRSAWDLLFQGYSPLKIIGILNNKFGLRTRQSGKKGGGPLCLSGIYKIFDNPFYYGVIRMKNDLYSGKHEPMVTQDEYWKAQEILGRPGRPRPKRHNFAFTGLIRCAECGSMITAEEKINRFGSHYIYYRCTKKKPGIRCHQKSLNLINLENQIIEFLENICVHPVLLDIAMDCLQKMEKDCSNKSETIRNSLEKAINDCRKRILNLNTMRVRELIDDNEYLESKKDLLKEKASLETNQNADLKAISINQTRETFNFAAGALKRFREGTPEEKRSILQNIGSNPSLKDKILIIKAKKPFEMIANTLRVLSEKIHSVEPGNNSFINKEKELLSPFFPLVWTLVQDVRTFYEEARVKSGHNES
jgi:site-specific DNA recombinase